MANFYTDNTDIVFLLRHLDLAAIANMQEEGFIFADEFDFAPKDADEAFINYDMVLKSVGKLSAEYIAPTAEDTDRTGNTLNEDGSVTYAPGIASALDNLAKAEVMGFTLPHRFGGINCPNLVYTMATEIVSRADASLMNLFGLQGIAETINAFASEEIKQKYLPDFALGKVTGAMVLTEPDAGSDLQACKVSGHDMDVEKPAAVYQDADGNWFIRGVKRFITNGCGEVLLVLARSERDSSDGRGLSLFLVEKGPSVQVRRLEDKLGIHGSPTCELFFNDSPAQLVGERQRGLITYVMALMNGARVGIAAQSMGIAESAYNVARDYGASRKQFGVTIEKLPAVRDMLIDMKIEIEAGRALLYETCASVDMALGFSKLLEEHHSLDAEEKKHAKGELRRYKRLASMLTPMSKYFCSEMSNRVAYDSIQVLGGSGYMRDYSVERHARDARITTIYEGTSQLQIVAAVRGVCSGTAEKLFDTLAKYDFDDSVKEQLVTLGENRELLKKAIAFVKENGNDYMDLCGRELVDIAIAIIIGYLFCQQASTKVDMEINLAANNGRPDPEKTTTMKKRKLQVAKRYITKNNALIKSWVEQICSGDKSTFSEFESLVSPLPAE